MFRFQLIASGAVQDIAHSILSIIYCIAASFLVCFYGQKITNEYENIEQSIYLMAWHLMPFGIRKKLPTMQAMAQRPVNLRGIAPIECSFLCFGKVID